MLGFELSISGRDDGTIEAIYISLSEKRIHKTDEVIPDVLLVDHDSQGGIVGIEILAPVQITKITRLVDQPQRRSLRRFIEQSAPEEMVYA
jgi:uncharacterized protein YuzE